MRYASERKVPNLKEKGLERICKPLLESKTKPLPPKQYVKLKYKIWPKITKKSFKKCLDASSCA